MGLLSRYPSAAILSHSLGTQVYNHIADSEYRHGARLGLVTWIFTDENQRDAESEENPILLGNSENYFLR